MLRVFQDIDGKTKTLLIYRYLSWLITSLFYLFGTPQGPIIYKLGVIASLFFLGYLVNRIYLSNQPLKIIQITVLIETLGLAILLIPTEGLFSPFLWYALNPVLVSASFFSFKYSWLDLAFFLMCSLAISLKIFNPENLSVYDLVIENSNTFLAFILFTIAMRLLIKMINHLNNLNTKLIEANKNARESMEHLMTLYQVIETLSMRDNPKKILTNIVKYTNNLLKCRAVFFSLIPFEDNSNFLFLDTTDKSSILDICGKDIQQYLQENQNKVIDSVQEVGETQIKDYICLFAPINSSSQCYGIIGFLPEKNVISGESSSNKQIIKFLADLSAVILERYYLEEMTSRLLISEEQNRIANEIHDSVSQRLFSIVYSSHSLNSKWELMKKDDISNQLALIKETANTAAQELRSSIYRLSSIKKGEKILFVNIKKYLNDVSALNGVEIQFNATGKDELLPIDLKQAIYRIIQEASGNAIRHGKCRTLSIKLSIDQLYTNIVIEDNGKGFPMKETFADLSNKGLGLNNIINLTDKYNGHWNIHSEIDRGTIITISIPLKCDVNNVDTRGVG